MNNNLLIPQSHMNDIIDNFPDTDDELNDEINDEIIEEINDDENVRINTDNDENGDEIIEINDDDINIINDVIQEELYSSQISQINTGCDNNYVENNSQARFAADPDYADKHLKDVYEYEEYYGLKNILEKMIRSFDTLVRNNKKFTHLRFLDVTNIMIGDVVGLNTQKGDFEVLYIFNINNILLKSIQERKLLQVDFTIIKSLTEGIDKLKSDQLSIIYCELDKMTEISQNNCIEFFDIFTNFFKADEKTLYNALPMNQQKKLLTALNERTRVLEKKGVKQQW